MLSDLQLVYMGPRNSTELLKINTTIEYQISSGARAGLKLGYMLLVYHELAIVV